MKISTQIKVRSYECDSYGHVNNAVYVNYLEVGRMEFLHGIGFDYNGIIDAGYFLFVSHIDIRYKASAHLDDILTIEAENVEMGAVSGKFQQCIKKEDGTVCAEAEVTWACVTKDGRPSRIPKDFIVPGLLPEKK